MSTTPFLFEDFNQVKDRLEAALLEQEETYLMLSGETGTGKTSLLREIQKRLDRSRYRVLYFSEARNLAASALVRVVARHLRVTTRLRHAESLDHLIAALAEESSRTLLWFDETQDLPRETLDEVRTLAEADLQGQRPFQVLFCGLPRMRIVLQQEPPLWRRILVREELTGLRQEEVSAFLEHHVGATPARRLDEEGQKLIFDLARGVPGLILPMAKTALARANGKGKIDIEVLEDLLQQWNLA